MYSFAVVIRFCTHSDGSQIPVKEQNMALCPEIERLPGALTMEVLYLLS